MLRAVLVLAVACSRPSTHEQPATANAYDAPEKWACRPDLPGDPCHGDLTTTEIAVDGTRTRVAHPLATTSAGDCFYIYPTVDLHLRAGNHTDFTDLGRIPETIRAQVGRFGEVCNLYAPLYRQITIGTYRLPAAERAPYVDVAYSDVAEAFQYYLAHADPAHQIVIVGHSQGARMATRLLQDTFDKDPALRARLLVAMPIGGQEDTSTFQTLKPCARDDERGCVIGYRSLDASDRPSTDAATNDPAPNGHWICVAPAESLASVFLGKTAGVDTPYVEVHGLYHAQCTADATGHDFLAIREVREPGDKRPELVELDRWHGKLGLHIFDFQFPQGDLVELIRKKSKLR